MPADQFYEDLGDRLASDEFCLTPEEAGEADAFAEFETEPVDMPPDPALESLRAYLEAVKLYGKALTQLGRGCDKEAA